MKSRAVIARQCDTLRSDRFLKFSTVNASSNDFSTILGPHYVSRRSADGCSPRVRPVEKKKTEGAGGGHQCLTNVLASSSISSKFRIPVPREAHLLEGVWLCCYCRCFFFFFFFFFLNDSKSWIPEVSHVSAFRWKWLMLLTAIWTAHKLYWAGDVTGVGVSSLFRSPATLDRNNSVTVAPVHFLFCYNKPEVESFRSRVRLSKSSEN